MLLQTSIWLLLLLLLLSGGPNVFGIAGRKRRRDDEIYNAKNKIMKLEQLKEEAAAAGDELYLLAEAAQ